MTEKKMILVQTDAQRLEKTDEIVDEKNVTGFASFQ